ncbi:hypothetical protein Tsubulata_011308 [Turnera subulata]|uniref:Anaphase-promoting complex subunit 4 WD40 domain-containing protein n=1 Tax=Turnera subulata TaxID=218843 RepID=A0A9Q0FVA1_9ROSI|nr:hypothetical protein Tsubulata_011308 [Turnera subulata]
MLSSDEGENDFFDCLSCLSSEREGVKCDCLETEFDVWLKEPQSVAERRRTFLSKMSLIDFASRSDDNIGLDRVTESSGAVSSSSASLTNGGEEGLLACGRETNSQANCMVDEMEPELLVRSNIGRGVENSTPSTSLQGCEQCGVGRRKNDDAGMKKMKRWWTKRWRERKSVHSSEVVKTDSEVASITKVKQNKKKCMEFTGVYMGQEIQGHKGYIATMKFNPDGQMLVSGGEDRVVRIWYVTSVNASCKSFKSEVNDVKEHKSSFVAKRRKPVSVVIPEKVFQIEESPFQEFHGHAGDILDVAWSSSNYILSSSMDRTVRLWQLGCSQSLHVFHHRNYVTCIQFNPINEQYFVSGSIDGKVRIWGVNEKRVVCWADVRDPITAVSYQPDGKGIVVGTVTGACRFYDVSGNDLQLMAELQIQSRKKSYSNGITGIKFSEDNSQRVLITSEDSKLRIFDGVDIVKKYKGLPKSGSQMSASFTSTGRHIISVGEDCRVYAWNYDGTNTPSSKNIKTVQSCEHFFSEGLSVAVPWSGLPEHMGGHGNLSFRSRIQAEQSSSWRKDSERFSDRFSLGGWFFMDGPCSRGSQTWPEEKLPLWDEEYAEDDYYQNPHIEVPQQQLSYTNNPTVLSDAWGLVIVTGSLDGKIRTFQNHGLPTRL